MHEFARSCENVVLILNPDQTCFQVDYRCCCGKCVLLTKQKPDR